MKSAGQTDFSQRARERARELERNAGTMKGSDLGTFGCEMLVKTISPWGHDRAVGILTECAAVACVRSRRAASPLLWFPRPSAINLTNHSMHLIVVS